MKWFENPSLLLRLTIALCYIALAIYLLINPAVIGFLQPAWRYALAVLIGCYGLFRMWRFYEDSRDL
ncbi:MAG: hypothetical protein U0T73_10050 [Chitinophagales bacterium]